MKSPRNVNPALFASCQVGLDWFTCPIISSDPAIQEVQDQIWANFLCCQVFPSSFLGDKTLGYVLHSPNFVARQFGFSQAFPASISFELKCQVCPAQAQSFKHIRMLLEENEERKNKYHLVFVKPISFVSQSFIEWWLDYYGSHR